jgi:hypothetical protein
LQNIAFDSPAQSSLPSRPAIQTTRNQ